MIKIEIVAQDIAEFFMKLRGLLAGHPGSPPSAPEMITVEQAAARAVLIAGMPAEPKVVKRRAAKGAGSEPEVFAPTVEVTEAFPVRQKVEQPAEVTAAMVRESLLALLQIGDDEPEAVLAAFQVKKISLLKPEEFAAVKVAADKRLKEWQDAK